MDPVHTSHSSACYPLLEPAHPEKEAARLKSATSLTSEHTCTVHPSPIHLHKQKIYGYAIAFILFESAFLIFAYYCLLHPIPLQSQPRDDLELLSSFNVTLTEFKAGITAVSVVWHTVACVFIKDIIALICSAEFMAQYRQSGDLNPGMSDRVSTITSGLVDNVVHFFGRSATRQFRLAFVAMLFVMALGPLGSGIITAGTTSTGMAEPITVANLTLTASDLTAGVVQNRASLIIRMERENITFGYNMSLTSDSDKSETVLIPWPNITVPEQSVLTYRSDVLQFSYQCAWNPNVTNAQVRLWEGEVALVLKDNDTRVSISKPVDTLALPMAFSPDNTTHIITNANFLFFNFSADTGRALSGFSDAFTAGFLTPTNNTPTAYRTGALLTCDPRSSIVPAEITVAQNTLTARRLPMPIDDPTSTMVGNISPGAAALITSTSLSDAVADEVNPYDSFFAYDLFIKPGFDDSKLNLLSLDEINKNMDHYTQSAGKAFLNGFVDSTSDTAVMLMTINQTAQITLPLATLVSSKPLLVAFTVVAGMSCFFLAAILWTIRDTVLTLFNLKNLIGVQCCACRNKYQDRDNRGGCCQCHC